MTVVRVRIVVQCAEAHGVLSVVGEGVVHESSAAAEVGLVAVDELLDGEFGEVAGLDVARSFDGSDGAECPAAVDVCMMCTYELCVWRRESGSNTSVGAIQRNTDTLRWLSPGINANQMTLQKQQRRRLFAPFVSRTVRAHPFPIPGDGLLVIENARNGASAEYAFEMVRYSYIGRRRGRGTTILELGILRNTGGKTDTQLPLPHRPGTHEKRWNDGAQKNKWINAPVQFSPKAPEDHLSVVGHDKKPRWMLRAKRQYYFRPPHFLGG